MKLVLKSVLFSILFLVGFAFVQAQEKSSYPFENEIIAFRQADAKNIPVKNAILFVGSSSIRLWNDLETRFAGQPIIRRGVGGCQLKHFVDYYMDAIVFPYQAKKIFIYAGENDVAEGQSPDKVVANFEKFWKLVHSKQPETSIYYMSIKPSNSRAKWLSASMEVNRRIKEFLKDKPRGTYIDMAGAVLGTNGQPDDRLFLEDKLHLNKAGYDKWEAVLKPYIK